MNFTVRTITKETPPSVLKAKKSFKLPAFLSKLVPKNLMKPGAKADAAQKTSLQKAFLIVTSLLIAVTIIAILFKILLSLQVFSLGSFANSIGTAPVADDNGFVNVLLVGQGDAGHSGVDLTDTIMIASIDLENTKSVVMTSIPRDTMVTTDYFGEQSVSRGRRINSVYRDIKSSVRSEGKTQEEASAEALQLFEKEIELLLGIEVYGTIKIDFIGFEQVVDELGGVEIDVPYALVDREYPDENYGYQVFSINAGLQTLDGATALKYARSRHSTSDFSRSARQQQIIAALGKKAKEEGMLTKPDTILALLEIASNHLQSTLRTTELIGLAAAGRSIDRDNILSFQLNNRNGLYYNLPEPGGLLYSPPREEFGGASVLLPYSIPASPITWKQPKLFVHLLNTYRDVYLAKPRIAVLNSGARSGAATLLGNELQRFGFNVITIENAEMETDAPTSVIYSIAPKDAEGNEIIPTETLESIGEIIGLPTIAELAPVPTDQQEIITIVLGEDYTYTPIQNIVLFSDSE